MLKSFCSEMAVSFIMPLQSDNTEMRFAFFLFLVCVCILCCLPDRSAIVFMLNNASLRDHAVTRPFEAAQQSAVFLCGRESLASYTAPSHKHYDN